MCADPGLDGFDDALLISQVLFRQVEQGGDGEIVGAEGLSCIGMCPEYGLVILLMAVGIFEGELRFADAAQAADRLTRKLRDGNGRCGSLVVAGVPDLL